MEENLPPGFRFHPTDEELIAYYLTRKVTEIGFVAHAIADVDLNKCEPWDLPGKASMGEKEWYFFSMKDRKYPTGLRTNRATDSGYWKTTGKDREIFQSGVLVGMKKTLVFYKGRAPKGEKTNWVMHEYRLQSQFPHRPTKEEWIVCRVFRKSCIDKKPEPNSPAMHCFEESPCNTTTSLISCELGELDPSILNINLANASSSSSNALQTNDHQIIFNDNKADTNMLTNWFLARDRQAAIAGQPLQLPWFSGILGPGFSPNPANILNTTSPLINGYPQPRQASDVACSLNSFVAHGDSTSFNGVNESKSSLFVPAASSSKGVVEGAQDQPQSFNQEQIWRGY